MKDFVPDEYYLSQNHPDPFWERTTIKYSVPDKIKVKLEVLDYDNRELKILVNETKEAGTYQVDFYTNGLKEGIYPYRITAGDIVITKRMLLLRK